MATQKKIVLTAEDRTKPAFRSVKSSMNQIESVASGLTKTFAVLAGATGLGMVARSFVTASDRATQLENKLQLVTDGSRDLTRVYGKLFELSKSTRVSFEATSELYARLARSSDQLGLSEEQLLQITKSLNQAFAVSGAGVMETASAVRQLGQGLASGTLRGDELRSVMENTPRVARMIAEGMGTTIGELRRLGSEGKLNAETVTTAILRMGGQVQQEFNKTSGTVSQATQQMSDSFMNFVNVVDEQTGAGSATARFVTLLSKGLDNISRRMSGDDPFGLFGMSLKELNKELSDSEIGLNNFLKLTKQQQENAGGQETAMFLFDKMLAIRAKIASKTGETLDLTKEINKETEKQLFTLDEIGDQSLDAYLKDLNDIKLTAEDIENIFRDQKINIEAGTKMLGARLNLQNKLSKSLADIDARLEDAGDADKQRIRQIKKNAQIELDINRKAFLADVQNRSEYETRKKDIVENTQNEIDLVRQQSEAKEQALNQQRLTSAIGTTTAMAAALKDESTELFNFYKAMAIAEATINTYNAATSALKIPYVGPFLAASMVALGFMYVQKIASMQPPGKAQGGAVVGGKSYVVGEKGPELFTPGKSGQINPNNSVGGSTNITFRISAIDAKGLNDLLLSRREMIIGMINAAQSRKLGRRL